MINRRTILNGGLAISATALLAACHHAWTLDPQDVSVRGHLPDLKFRMTDVTSGHIVTQANFRGFVTLVYFGYTNCPDICPLTVADIVKIIGSLGPDGAKLRFLFVTVDPERDTAPILAKYLRGPTQRPRDLTARRLCCASLNQPRRLYRDPFRRRVRIQSARQGRVHLRRIIGSTSRYYRNYPRFAPFDCNRRRLVEPRQCGKQAAF
ncbi:MAG: hypothetical protein B7X48_04915 [Acidiphilium sp. 34-60-192]|nr:MAG: hypothetical protein B7X48_04915 [Acidiphilium sp. 34-60-192]